LGCLGLDATRSLSSPIQASVNAFLEGRLDTSGPLSLELLYQPLGFASFREDRIERIEKDGFVKSTRIAPVALGETRANLKFGTIDGLGLLEGGDPAETREKRQFALKTATFQFECPPNGNGGGGACRRRGRGRGRPPAW
jgi:hypothetical protein